MRSTKPIQDLRIGDEVLAWDELAAHDAQASRQPVRLKQASHTASAINVAAAPAIPSAQRYEKVTEIAHSVKAQTLIHIALDNGQHITATAGHPFKTSEGWRDAVLLKKGGKLLLKDSESDAQAAPRFASITAVSTEIKTTPVYNLEAANLHTFFVGADGVGVHNGSYSFGQLRDAVEAAYKELGVRSLPKCAPGKWGSPQRGSPKKGIRFDKQGHPDHPDPNEHGPHINFWDYTGGKKGRGGNHGAIPL